MMQLSILCSLALAGTALALPTATKNANANINDAHAADAETEAPAVVKATRTLDTRGSAADTVVAIMPLSTSCSGRGDECVTADVAAPYLANGMAHYNVNTAIEQAGILALVAYESGQMQYKINTNSANAASGQGTSNEQSGTYNLEFANTFDELKSLGLTTSNVLDHVTDNKYNFWTGPWYYSSYEGCATARSMLSTGSTAWEWFEEYMANCDGVPLATSGEPDRITFWNNALNAFGLTNSSTAS